VQAGSGTPQQGGKFGKKVVMWLALVGVILAGIAVMMFTSVSFLLKSEGWVAHSYQVLDTLDLTESRFTDAQSAERGYVATCKPAMLSPFKRDLPQIFGDIAALRTLTADNPAQHVRAMALGTAITGELERMSGIIATTTGGHQIQAETMLADPGDNAAIRKIRVLIDDMQVDERALLTARLRNVTFFAWATLASSAVGVLAIAAILLFVLRLIRRETARREATETSLQDSNQKLGVSLEELHRYNVAAQAVSVLGELLQTCRSTGEAVAIAGRHLRETYPQASFSIALAGTNRGELERITVEGDGTLFSPEFRATDCWGLRRARLHQAGPGSFEPCCDHLHNTGGHYACVPLLAQGDTLGVLTVAMDNAIPDFDRQNIQTVCEQLALALANLGLQESLRNQSVRDPLTGLFNRRFMDEAMERETTRAMRGKQPLTVAMLDIDHFKRFNDTYGHEGGDALLSAFAKLLTKHARREDIVCRYGGEEFAIILPGASLEAAAARLEEIRLAVKSLQATSGGRPLGAVSMSAGIALFPRDGATAAQALAAADAALYRAKHEGRDRVICAQAPEKQSA